MLQPELLSALLNRATAERRTGQLPQALKDYDAYLARKTDNPLAFNNRGSARFENKDYDGAIADFSQVLQLDPKYAYAPRTTAPPPSSSRRNTLMPPPMPARLSS